MLWIIHKTEMRKRFLFAAWTGAVGGRGVFEVWVDMKVLDDEVHRDETSTFNLRSLLSFAPMIIKLR